MRILDNRDVSASGRARSGDERDGIADQRDAIAERREVAWIRWEAKCQAITTDADLRDQGADERDAEARRRDEAAGPDVYLGRPRQRLHPQPARSDDV